MTTLNSGNKINPHLNDDAVLAELGQRLAQQRLAMGLTQAQLADQSGVAKRTLERAESGKSIQLITLIRLLRVLDLLSALDQWLPARQASPMTQLAERKGRYQAKQRQRVRSGKDDGHQKPWTWGEDA